MNTANNKQSLFQVLSLDVVLGSLAVGLFAVTILDVQANPWWWVIMPMAVWVVYSLDHLLDGFKKKDESTIYRHLFHFRQRIILGSIVLIVGTLTIILSFIFLDGEIIFRGIILSVFVLIYFAMVYLLDKFSFNHFLKEFVIAIVYISGIFLAPLVWYNGLPSYPVLLSIVFLFLLAWLESAIISWFDYERDIANGFKSFTVVFGLNAARKIILIALSIISISLIISIFVIPHPLFSYAFGIELVMSLSLLILILRPRAFEKQNLFRWIGESVFYLPALIYFYS